MQIKLEDQMEKMPRLIKIAGKYLIKPQALIYDISIEIGQVSCQWKMGYISAIFQGKWDEYHSPKHRLIFVTSCLSSAAQT